MQLAASEMEQLVPIVRRSCRSQARPFGADGDEALGEVFLRVVTNCQRQAAIPHLDRFAARTARYEARRLFLRQARTQGRPLPEGLSDGGRGDPLALLTSEEEEGAVRRALSALPPRQKEAVLACSEARGRDGRMKALAAAWGCTARGRINSARTPSKACVPG
jgi:DNA-directed RNA polymerase specialized sigma24 family protein